MTSLSCDKKLHKASRCTYTGNDVKYMLTMKTKAVLKKVRYYSTSILVKAIKIKSRMKFSQHTLANRRRGAVVKGVEHISTIVLVNNM